jgi:hypothetical protein
VRMSELQSNPTLSKLVEESRAAVVGATLDCENFAADLLKGIIEDTGTIPKSEYTDALVMSMLCAEIRRLRARVDRLESRL